jgi:hypothetical protein
LDFFDYLDAYARTFDLPIRPETNVVALRREAGLWSVRTAEGVDLSARSVVVATGVAAGPYAPELPGLDRFGGRVIHSRLYRRPEPFLGERVLVVGAGNSAADISTELARAGVAVTLSVRSGATVVPLSVAGIPIQYFGFALGPLPLGARRAIASLAGRLATFRSPGPLPHAPIAECTGVPVIGDHLTDALRTGALRLTGKVIELVPGGARFAGGETSPFDSVVLATGYRAAIGFLEGAIRRDSCGFALRVDDVTSADQPDLYFVGHNPDVRGSLYRIGRDARLAAKLVRSGPGGAQRRSTEREPRRYGR